MFCTKCGKELKDGSAFCIHCGAPVAAAANANNGAATIKKSGKKTLFILAIMIIVFFGILIAFFAVIQGLNKDGEEDGGNSGGASANQPFAGFPSDLSIGDRVVFGSYEQDNISSNGAEPLEWDVIGKNGNQYLLITHYVIDNKQYDDGTSDTSVNAGGNATDAEVTWAKCSLRMWLNSDFYNDAFTDEERAYIATVNNKNPSWIEFDDNHLGAEGIDKGGYGGSDTQDKVFLLSVPEVITYLGPMVLRSGYNRDFFPSALASGTFYTQSKNEDYNIYGLDDLFGDASVRESSGSAWREYYEGYVDQDYIEKEALMAWFTRSPGCYKDGSAAMVILGDGGPKPGYLKSNYCGIRPVVWVTVG